MRYLILIPVLIGTITMSVMAQPQSQPTDYSAMTWNIRYNTPNDGENWWEHRKAWVANLISYYEPDILGIQEGLHGPVQYLDSALSRYTYQGVGRDDGNEAGEYSAVYYRKDKLEALDHDTFWLSETPGNVSVGWDASMERICTWVHFRDRETNRELWVFNAHLDHRGPESRLHAVKLIHQKIKELSRPGEAVILMGDLNARPEDPPVQYLNSVLHDSRSVSLTSPYGPEGTYNGFDTSHPLDERIDYIFVNESISVQKYAVIADTRNRRTPSDHLPVLIHFGIK